MCVCSLFMFTLRRAALWFGNLQRKKERKRKMWKATIGRYEICAQAKSCSQVNCTARGAINAISNEKWKKKEACKNACNFILPLHKNPLLLVLLGLNRRLVSVFFSFYCFWFGKPQKEAQWKIAQRKTLSHTHMRKHIEIENRLRC